MNFIVSLYDKKWKKKKKLFMILVLLFCEFDISHINNLKLENKKKKIIFDHHDVFS